MNVEQELFVEFDHIWPVNTALLQNDGPREDPIACPEFATVYKSVAYKWQLLLYLNRPPAQQFKDAALNMGLYLTYKDGPIEYICVDCEMFVLAPDHSRACNYLAKGVELEAEGRAWGYGNFCPQNLQIMEQKAGKRTI